jgi:hypothetical protein
MRLQSSYQTRTAPDMRLQGTITLMIVLLFSRAFLKRLSFTTAFNAISPLQLSSSPTLTHKPNSKYVAASLFCVRCLVPETQ